EGQAICWLVSLASPVTDLVAEYDCHLELRADDEQSADDIQATDEEQHAYHSFKRMLHWCPRFKKLISNDVNNHEVIVACQELKKGADCARGDDANMLKSLVASWLNEALPHCDTVDKSGHRFYHDITSRLLCPVDYNWLDVFIWSAIREYHPKFPVTADTYPTYLYPGGQYDARNPSKGLFKGELLIRAFCCIFTSPSSAELGMDDNETAGPHKKARKTMSNKTHCDVAGLLKISTSWNVKDEDFDYILFYQNIIDYFECPSLRQKAEEVEDILLWWNWYVISNSLVSALS
ncbi:hypothetical protein SCLCIDRAFT_135221, partial [Scleroderma citrinum Foug A]